MPLRVVGVWNSKIVVSVPFSKDCPPCVMWDGSGVLPLGSDCSHFTVYLIFRKLLLFSSTCVIFLRHSNSLNGVDVSFGGRRPPYIRFRGHRVRLG